MNRRHNFLNKLGLCPDCLASKLIERMDEAPVDKEQEQEQEQDGESDLFAGAEKMEEKAETVLDNEDEAIADLKNAEDELKNAVTLVQQTSVPKEQAKIVGDAILQLFQTEYFKRMNEVDNEITYRRFYFYGDEVKLLSMDDGMERNHIGVDDVKYYDFRYFDDYISLCQSYRWQQNFIIYNYQGKYEAYNFNTAITAIKNSGIKFSSYTESTGGTTESNYLVSSILTSLYIMGKLESFCDTYKYDLRAIGILEPETSAIVRRLLDYLNDENYNTAQLCLGRMKSLFGVSMSSGTFDYWLAPEDQRQLWFLDAAFIARYDAIRMQYQKVLKELMNLIKNAPALTICTNNFNGKIYGGQQTMTQVNNCLTNISQKTDDDGGSGGGGSGGGGDSSGGSDSSGSDGSGDNSGSGTNDANKKNNTNETTIAGISIKTVIIIVCILLAIVIGGFSIGIITIVKRNRQLASNQFMLQQLLLSQQSSSMNSTDST